jgi:hypothetical protein
MKPEKVKDTAEMIGIAAIVLSLVFVGLEIRQSAAATRGATQQALADSAKEASGALVADEEMAELTLRFLTTTDWNEFSDVERFRAVVRFTSMVRVYESAYYQWSEGNLAPEIWAGWEASIGGVAPMPGVAVYWGERRLYFDERFQIYFEEKMRGTVDSPSLGTENVSRPEAP